MKFILTAMLALFVSSSALAAPPSDASLEKLLQVTGAENLSKSVRNQFNNMMGPMFAQAIDAKNLTPEKRQEAERFMQAFSVKVSKIMDEEMAWDRLKRDYMQIYRESFSQKEVNDLIAFYESPTGKDFVRKMPVVMQKSMALVKQRMVPMMQKIQAAAQETAAEFKQESQGTTQAH